MQRSKGRKQYTTALRQNDAPVLLMPLYFIFAKNWFQSADLSKFCAFTMFWGVNSQKTWWQHRFLRWELH